MRVLLLENELDGPPLAHVQVRAGGANAAASMSNGTFVLDFRRKQPGDTVQLELPRKIRDQEMVVVNDFQLEVVLPRDPDARVVKLLLTTAARREEMARRFYRLKGFEAIEANYRKKLAALSATNEAAQAEKEAIEAEKERLRQERDEAIERMETMAEEMARVTADDASDLYRRAITLYLDGHYEEALSVLDEEKLDQAQGAAKAKTDSVVDTRKLKGQMLLQTFDLEGAARSYQKAVDAAADDLSAVYTLAYLRRELNQLDAAERGYVRALALARERQSRPAIAQVLNNLGLLLALQGRKAEASAAHQEALTLRRKLAAEDLERYRPDLAATLTNLAVLCDDMFSQCQDARGMMQEALQIEIDLSTANPEVYRPHLARMLHNYGLFLSRLEDMQRSRIALDASVTLFRELARVSPDAHLVSLAETLDSLGTLDHRILHQEPAAEAFAEAVRIRREIARQRPATQPALADALRNLADVYRHLERYDEGLTVYQEALWIYRAVAARNPDVYGPSLALTLRDLAILEAEQGRLDEAGTVGAEAVDLYRQLAVRRPDPYLPLLGVALNNLGAVRRAQRRFTESGDLLLEAAAIFTKALEETPGAYDIEHMQVFASLAELMMDARLVKPPDAAHAEAREMVLRMTPRNPAAYLPEVAIAMSRRCEALAWERNDAGAHAMCDAAAAVYEELAKSDRDYRAGITRVRKYLSEMHDPRIGPAACAGR